MHEADTAGVSVAEGALTVPFSGPKRSWTTSTSLLLFNTNAPMPTCMYTQSVIRQGKLWQFSAS